MGSAALLFFGFGIVMFELRDFLDNGVWYILMDLLYYFFVVVLLGFGVNYLIFGVIKVISGLTFKVMG